VLRTADPNIRLILARRKPDDQLLDEIQLVHHLGEVVAGLGRLTEGEALGIKVTGHVRIINRGVVNGRFTASAPSRALTLPEPEDRDPR